MKAAITALIVGLFVLVFSTQRCEGVTLPFGLEPLQGVPVAFPFSSGNLDSTFDIDGIVTLSPGFANDVAQAVAIQADGKIVTVGYGANGMYNAFAVTRINPDGTPDTGFDNDGLVLTSVGPRDAEAFGVAIQNDGKIVVVGQASNGLNSDIAIVRYNANGMLDTTFDTDGIMMVDVAGRNDLVRSVAVQADGKIVAAGSSSVGSTSDVAVVRLETNGSLDSSFNGNSGNGRGIVTTPVGSGNDFGYAAAIQPNGRIVVSGYYTGPASTDTFILRYDLNGVLDTTFSGDGRALFAFSPNDVDEALAMALQPDGQIVVAGCIRGNGRLNDYLIARIDSSGALDQTFGSSGFTIVDFSPSPDIALGVAVQADGKIVAAGFANNGTNNDFGVTRLTSNGRLDPTFHGDGRQQTMFGTSTDSANGVAIQADGKVVVVGRAVVGSMAKFGISRYGYGTNELENDGFIEIGPTTEVRFDNAFQAGTSSVATLTPESVPLIASGWIHAGSPLEIQTTALFSGNVLVRLTLPSNLDPSTFAAVRILQHENGVWTDKTASTPARNFSSRTIYATVTSAGLIAAAWPSAEISGRVTTPTGLGLRNAVVSITDASGTRRTATTSSFGNFTFTGIPSGQMYNISVASKRYRFAVRMVEVSNSLTDLNFIGLE